MLRRIKKHAGAVYIAAMTLMVIVILACSGEWRSVVAAVQSMRPEWAGAATGCIGVYLFLRMATLKYYLGRRGYPITWRNAAAVTGAGQFYSAITPSASGGQPMQVLYLSRKGVPAGIGTACVAVKFIGFQAAVLLTGGTLWLANRRIAAQQLFGFRWLIALGFAANAALLIAVLLTTSHADILKRIIQTSVRLGKRLRIVKDPKKTEDRLRHAVDDYRVALRSLLEHPLDIVVILAISVLQVLSYMSIIICLYRAFSLSGTKAGQLLTLQYLLFIAAAFIPLPGAAGAQEGGFCVFFRDVFPVSQLTAAMVCWRFFSYYLLMFAGLVMMTVGTGSNANAKAHFPARDAQEK